MIFFDAPWQREDEPLFKCMRWAAIADVLHADHSEAAAPPPAAGDSQPSTPTEEGEEAVEEAQRD